MDNRGQWEGNVACVVQSGSARGGKGLWVRRVWPAYGARSAPFLAAAAATSHTRGSVA